MFLTGKCIYTSSDDKIKSSLLHEGRNEKMQGTMDNGQYTKLKIEKTKNE